MATRAATEMIPVRPARRLVPLALLPDDALAERVAREGEPPFEVLYRRHRDRLYAYCAAILRQPEDAEEALQSAMLGAYRSLRAAPSRDLALRPWLHRIAHNQCIDILRRRPGDAPEPLTGLEASPEPGPAERIETAEALVLLRQDLQRLPDEQRAALVLRELSGLSHDEIAGVLGEEPARVKQLIHMARRGLGRMAEGRALECDVVRRRLSDADGRVTRGQGFGAHLRVCPGCREFRRAIAQRSTQLAAIAPVLPLAVSERIVALLRDGATASGGMGSGGIGAAASGALSTLSGALASKATVIAVVGLAGGSLALVPVAVREPAPDRPAALPAPASATPGPTAALAVALGSGTTTRAALQPAAAVGATAPIPAVTGEAPGAPAASPAAAAAPATGAAAPAGTPLAGPSVAPAAPATPAAPAAGAPATPTAPAATAPAPSRGRTTQPPSAPPDPPAGAGQPAAPGPPATPGPPTTPGRPAAQGPPATPGPPASPGSAAPGRAERGPATPPAPARPDPPAASNRPASPPVQPATGPPPDPGSAAGSARAPAREPASPATPAAERPAAPAAERPAAPDPGTRRPSQP